MAAIDREMDEHTAAVAEKRREIDDLSAAVADARRLLISEREALAAISAETFHYAAFGAAFFAGQEERIDNLLARIALLEHGVEAHLEGIRELFGEKEKYRLLLDEIIEKARHAAALKEEAESDERIRQRSMRKNG